MKTGIVILNYNDYKTTIEMINQIKNYKSLDYILIVDNNSTDDSYKILKKYEKNNIEIIKTKSNKGYASGNNYGMKYLIKKYDVDYIIISNPDIIVKEKVIDKLKQDLKKHEDFALIAPNIIQLNEKLRGWKLPSYKDDLLLNINYFHKIREKKLRYASDYYKGEFSEVEAVSGCFFMIKKEALIKVDYYDENTFLYYEENILGKKLKSKKLKTYIDNKLEVIHNLSVSVDKSVKQIKKYKILKDSQRYYEKKYNNINIFQMFLLRFLYYISLIISYIVCFIRKIGGKK